MSLIAAVFGQGVDDERKVPETATPSERLRFLNKSLIQWIGDNFTDKRPIRAGNIVSLIQWFSLVQ